MIHRMTPFRWLCSGLSILSLCLAITLTPARATSLSPVPAPPQVAAEPVLLSQQVTNWIDQGRSLYRSGDFTAAVAAWQTAAQSYRAQGDRLNEALSLSYLSLGQQELNQWDAAQQSIEQSLALLKAATPAADAILWAQVINTQANLQLRIGDAETALENWQTAQKYYDQVGDIQGSLGAQINQAKALQSLGFYRRSKQQLEGLVQKLAAMPESEITLTALRTLGLAFQEIGDPAQSQQVLQQSLEIVQNLGAKTQFSSLLLNLGKARVSLHDPSQALEYFEQAETTALNPSDGLQARLAQFNLFLEYEKLELAAPLAPQLIQQLRTIPASRLSLYAAINFVAALNRVPDPTKIVPLRDLAELMAATVQSAQQIQNFQAESYAFYQWGQLYRRTGQSAEAKEVTQKSLEIARQLRAENIIAQAAWQSGQIYRQEGNRTAAITAYTEAVNALKALQGDLVAINSDVQFSFRASVEPIYREFVGLLLDDQPSQAALLQARELIEALQIAELNNFFREACLDKAQQIDQVDPTAMIVYPIILPDRLAVILSQSGRPLRYYVTYQSQAETEKTLQDFLVSLNPVSDIKDRDRLSRKIYDWLIRGGEVDQAFKDSKTLVFVLDGRLRNIPIAALYDGQQYLIEKYAIALSPGLQLMASRGLQQNSFSAIIGGISQARGGFSALPEVESEVKKISQLVQASLMLNQEFTSQALSGQIKGKEVDVVHLATHGQFSSNLEDTFLLTWDGRISINELSDLIKNRGATTKAIELLVLSACDTAAGDDRAVLGLAGLAVKSGARSTIATLWPVKDKAAELLMTRFYEQFQKPGVTKAEALRQSQIHMIRQTDFRNPFFWSTFVLVGNWK